MKAYKIQGYYYEHDYNDAEIFIKELEGFNLDRLTIEETNSIKSVRKELENYQIRLIELDKLVNGANYTSRNIECTVTPKLPSIEELTEYIDTAGHGLVPDDFIRIFHEAMIELIEQNNS